VKIIILSDRFSFPVFNISATEDKRTQSRRYDHNESNGPAQWIGRILPSEALNDNAQGGYSKKIAPESRKEKENMPHP
jgi:hypothetical protein